MAVLNRIGLLVQPVDEALYGDFEQLARERMAARDLEGWPIAAVSLMLNLPVWTEYRDFFGSELVLDDGSSRIVPARPPWITASEYPSCLRVTTWSI